MGTSGLYRGLPVRPNPSRHWRAVVAVAGDLTTGLAAALVTSQNADGRPRERQIRSTCVDFVPAPL